MSQYLVTCTLNTINAEFDGTMEQLSQAQPACGNYPVKILTVVETILCNPLGTNLPIPINKTNLITDHTKTSLSE